MVVAMPPLLNAAKTLFLNSAREFQEDGGMQMAAAISYYVLFSLFPLLIFAAGMAGLFLDEDAQQKIIDLVLDNIPLTETDGRDAVTEAVEGIAGPGGGGVGLFGLLAMAWSGSNLFGAIRRALNVAFDDVETQRPFVQAKLIDLALVLALSLFFMTSIAGMAALRVVRRRSEDLAAIGEAADAMGALWDAGSYFLPLLFSFAAFMVLYTLAPARPRRPAQVWPGALVAAVLFETGKFGFSVYLENFGNYDVVLGALGAVVAFLFWVYLSANFMIFGAEIASEYPKVRPEKYSQPKLEGMKTPLRERIWHTVRRLFVRT
jgi:membrane protein